MPPLLRPLTLLSVLGLASTLGCHDEQPEERHEPMRATPAAPATTPRPSPAPDPSRASPPSHDGTDTDTAQAARPASVPVPSEAAERPPADPAIDRALDLISSSGLRFIDQAADEDSRPSEYTAEQFSAMLRSKWEWIGYDITDLDPWLNEIAARSFKSNLPYQVVLSDGTIVEIGPWLQQQISASEDP